jgi:NAD+ diphosphatase
MNSLVNTALSPYIYFFNSEKYVDARWFTRDEVRSVLEHKAGTRFNKSDYKKMNEMTEGRSNLEQNAKVNSTTQVLTPAESKTIPKQPSYSDELPFKLPAVSAIAGVLIRDWVDGKIGFPQESAKGMLQRVNL